MHNCGFKTSFINKLRIGKLCIVHCALCIEKLCIASRAKRGMTLVEVLLAITILGVGLTAIMVGMTQALGLMRASKEYLDAQWVLGLGELKNPIRETDDVMEKVPVAAESLDDLLDDEMKKRRYVFEREVEEKPDDPDIEDDGLYVVTSRVSWGGVRYRGYKGSSEEVVRLVLEKK